MRIAVLGPLEVHGDDSAPIAVPGAKERQLLAVLAVAAPAAVGTGRIIEELWAGDPPATARRSLQAHVVRLRSALEPDRPKGSSGRYVARRGLGYALVVEREELDALRFADLSTQGRGRLAIGHAAEAELLLSTGLALWRGPPYADWPDAPFADTERRRLEEARSGAVQALIEARLGLGRHGDVLPDLERLVIEEPLREEWWRLLMLALYRAGRQADALAAGRRVRALLVEELGVSPGTALRTTEAAILTQDPALELIQAVAAEEPAGPAPELRRAACPYKGLAAYQTDDAAMFRGRDRLVETLVARLIDAALVVVSGPSGAGKSSVVRAGLVPALARGAVRGSEAWWPVVVTPGHRPVDVIADLTGTDPPRTPTLLVCDQFEELWAPAVGAAERTAFLDTVLGLLDDGIVTRFVAVVRGDHVGRLAEHGPFTERLGTAIVLVPALTDPELRAVVCEPAAAVGLAVEAELVDTVVGHVLGRSGALPLLSTALVGTWERRRGGRLTLAGYLDAGGVGGALMSTAEAAFAALGDDERHVARSLLVRLADADEGGAYVRRRVPLVDLYARDDRSGPRRGVVDQFVDRRLLVSDGERIEVAHESLFTAWPRLAKWLDEDAAGRAVRRHLAPAAHEWEERGRAPEELYRGPRLAAALDWSRSEDADPTPLEQEFLRASRERGDSELRDAREQVTRERRARRYTRRLAIGLAAVLVVALVATGLAVRIQRAADLRAAEAQRISRIADANRLATLADAPGPLDLSLLLATQAVRLADSSEAQGVLLGKVLGHPRAVRVTTVDKPVRGMALGAGGTLVMDDGLALTAWSVTASGGGRSLVPHRIGGWAGWLVADGSPSDDLIVGAGTDIYDHLWLRLISAAGQTRPLVENADLGRPIGVTFSHDGRRVDLFVVSGALGGPQPWHVVEFDVTTGTQRDLGISGSLPASAGAPVADIDADGRTAVVFDQEDPSVPATLVDLAGGGQSPVQTPRRPLAGTTFRALGSGAAQMWTDGGVTLYGPDGRPVQQLQENGDPVQQAVLAPDGTWAAVAHSGGLVTLYDVDPTSGAWAIRESFAAHAGDVRGLAVTSDGRRLVTVGVDDRIAVWDSTPGGGFGSPVEALGNRWLAGRPQVVTPGRLVVVPTRPVSGASQDEDTAPDSAAVDVTFLDPRDGRVVADVPVGEIGGGRLLDAPSMAVSPDRRRVAITTGLTTTVLDTRTRHQVGQPIVLPPRGDVGADGGPLPAAFVSCLTWTADSSRLLLCTRVDSVTQPSSAVVLVDPSNGRELRAGRFSAAVDGIATSPDGGTLVLSNLQRSGLPTGQLLVVDARSLKLNLSVSFGEPDRSTDMSFSPDGRQLAITGRSGALYLVDTSNWEPARTTIRSGASVLQAEWLPDGRTVALAGSDGTVTLFDAARNRLWIPTLSASGNGRSAHVHVLPVTSGELVAMSGEETGRRWPLDPQAWVRQACAVVGRDFTRVEWARYLPDRTYRPTCTDLH